MNGRKMYREYAQFKGKVATSFIEIKRNYGGDTLITSNEKGRLEETFLDYEDVVNFIIRRK